jgi:hypothetical protein
MAGLLKKLNLKQTIEALVNPDYAATQSKLIAPTKFVTVLVESERTYLRPKTPANCRMNLVTRFTNTETSRIASWVYFFYCSFNPHFSAPHKAGHTADLV